ncbi:MAG: SUMF1/EgtB/PvdO family nonheme iron enzyme [Ferruginibacter sp.]|nr:SUMF1/EgtB/PvdO family nonheme iron enzyme [Ferruginibacter sp.]
MKKLLFIFFWMSAFAITKANNIQITNVSVVPANSTIKFDVSWDNGWRSSVLNNWDAAYVFFKVKDVNGNWGPLSVTAVNDVTPSGFIGAYINSYLGKFFYRATSGSGTTTITNIEIGIDPPQASGIFDIKGFAIEMVYVPQTGFYPGDGSSTNSYTPDPAYGTTLQQGTATHLIDPLATPTLINATGFQNGFKAFYCMKYELSMGGYRDFLNTLTYTQQIPHIVPAPSATAGSYALINAYRNNIKIKTAGIASSTPAVFGCDANNNLVYDEADDGEWIACNYLNWVDHAAYLAWAGLRPLTELEYEKAARGIQLPVASEYAWGNNQISTTIYNYATPNTTSETITNGSATIGNANYGSTYPFLAGPTRTGVFATATSNRITSGGSFYGVMDLSGNLAERVISTTMATNSSYATLGVRESVQILANGYAGFTSTSSAFNWPGSTIYFIPPALGPSYINGTVNATGLIYKGGHWSSSSANLRISDRSGLLVTDPNIARSSDVGIRGCATAP